MTPSAQPDEVTSTSTIARSRKWMAIAFGLAALGYVVYAVWHGLHATTEALGAYRWETYLAVLGLALVNYVLRYIKWSYLLGRVGIHIPHSANGWVFTTGLAMVITPGKLGELVKPYLVRELTGTSMARSVPVLVAERVTDGLAVVALAMIGASTLVTDSAHILVITLSLFTAGLIVLAIEPLSLGIIGLIRAVPIIGKAAGWLEESYRALRTCLAPLPLISMVLLSLLAWGAECVGYWLVFGGLGVETTLETATTLYASATVFGAPSPGGMVMADAALVEGSRAMIEGISNGEAMAAAILIRIATLWFGVVLGALAMLRIEAIVEAHSPFKATLSAAE